MIKYLLLITLSLFAQLAFSQEIRARIYGKDKVIKAAVIHNVTQDKYTQTNAQGYFSLPAKGGDSLVVSASTWATQYIKINQNHLNEVWVIEMAEAYNALDEVKLFSKSEAQETFNIKTYDREFNAAIAKDREENPHLYRPPGAQQGVDFIQLAIMAARLLKGKEHPRQPQYDQVDYTDLHRLFATGGFFNEALLRKQLNIPEKFESLFFDFCAAQGMSERLMLQENQLELLDFFVNQSAAYQKIIAEATKE